MTGKMKCDLCKYEHNKVIIPFNNLKLCLDCYHKIDKELIKAPTASKFLMISAEKQIKQIKNSFSYKLGTCLGLIKVKQ